MDETHTVASVSAPHFQVVTLVALHLFPGALTTVGFVAVASSLAPSGAPANLALLLTFLLVGVPFQLATLCAYGWRLNGRISLDGVIEFRDSLSFRMYWRLILILLLWSIVAYGLAALAGEGMRQAFFAWWPDWLSITGLAQNIDRHDSTILWGIVGLSLVMNVVGPLVEELYFRGFLLPRMGRFGNLAPLVNTILFSLYHFWLPWEFFARAIALLPVFYAVWWKRNIYLGIWVHVLLNSIGSLGLLALVLSRG
jgi:uncharacterized protein